MKGDGGEVSPRHPHLSPISFAFAAGAAVTTEAVRQGEVKVGAARQNSFSMSRCRTRTVLFLLRLQAEGRFRLGADLVEGDAGGELDERHAAAGFLVDGEDAEVGDHHVDDAGAGER
jgi:hypothetical protein